MVSEKRTANAALLLQQCTCFLLSHLKRATAFGWSAALPSMDLGFTGRKFSKESKAAKPHCFGLH